jgi:hypothetical protein
MQKLADFVPAFSHHLKPPMCDGSQFAGVRFPLHPSIDGGIALDSAVESQEFCFHRCSTFCYEVPLPSLQQNRSPGVVGLVEGSFAPG